MSGPLLYNMDAMMAAGDQAGSRAQQIQTEGDELYAHLNNLFNSEQLTGDGIAQALATSQSRWNAALADFARAELEFGRLVQEAAANMNTTDQRGGALISGA